MKKIEKVLENLLYEGLRRRVGEHEMVECKICNGIGHNDIVGHQYGIRHDGNCAWLEAYQVLYPLKWGKR